MSFTTRHGLGRGAVGLAVALTVVLAPRAFSADARQPSAKAMATTESGTPIVFEVVHEHGTVTAAGETRITRYRERRVQDDRHVWVERLQPAGADDVLHAHAHPHSHAHAGASDGELKKAAPLDDHEGAHEGSHEGHGHKHLDMQSADRLYVLPMGNEAGRLEVMDAEHRARVFIPEAEYGVASFDGQWGAVRSLVDPARLEGLSKTKGRVRGTEHYSRVVAKDSIDIDWDPVRKLARRIEWATTDHRSWYRAELTSPRPLKGAAPWQSLQGWSNREYSDYLD